MLEGGFFRRVLVVLAVFLPAAWFLAELQVVFLGWDRVAALRFFLPVVGLHAFSCAASWYVCRSLPLQRRFGRVVAGQSTAALASALVATAFARWWLGWTMPGAADRFPDLRLLLAFSLLFLYALVVTGNYLVLALEASRRAQNQVLEARFREQEARVQALRAQLHPHFLFNCLSSIAALAATDPPAARRMCQLLAAFLRRSLRATERGLLTLREELELNAAYLAVEQQRFGERLRVDWTLDEEVDRIQNRLLVPSLILQPLVENSVRHGLESRLEGGRIDIVCRRVRSWLVLEVSNPYDPDGETIGAGAGIGLANVRKRLELLRPPGTLKIDRGSEESTDAGPGHRHRVRLELPIRWNDVSRAGLEGGGGVGEDSEKEGTVAEKLGAEGGAKGGGEVEASGAVPAAHSGDLPSAPIAGSTAGASASSGAVR